MNQTKNELLKDIREQGYDAPRKLKREQLEHLRNAVVYGQKQPEVIERAYRHLGLNVMRQDNNAKEQS